MPFVCQWAKWFPLMYAHTLYHVIFKHLLQEQHISSTPFEGDCKIRNTSAGDNIIIQATKQVLNVK